MVNFHVPVMLDEVIRWLEPKPGGHYIDVTIGGGGHAEAVLEKTSPDGQLIGMDRDEDALSAARKRLGRFGSRVRFLHSTFDRIEEVAREQGFTNVNGVLADLGVSSYQFDAHERGFSFMRDGPLDMRMDRSLDVTAASLVAELPEDELARIIFDYGEERHARRIAKHLCRMRAKRAITTTGELAAIISDVLPRRGGRIHPATRTFQALRIAVNDELGMLERFLTTAPKVLAPKGRLVVVSYHSLEDRMVKKAFRDRAKKEGAVLTKKVIVSSSDERAKNPRARSAKLRAYEQKTV